MAGIVVDGCDGGAHLLIGEGEEPADVALGGIGEVQAQGLNDHHVGELLRDQRAAGLRIAQLLFHAFEGPAQRCFVGLLADMDDGRQGLQQHVSVGADEGEVAADEIAAAAFIAEGGGAGVARGENDAEVDRREGEIGREREGKSAGQKETVAGVEEHGGGNGFDCEPALAGDDGVALDALMPGELDGHVAIDAEAAGDVAARFEQG